MSSTAPTESSTTATPETKEIQLEEDVIAGIAPADLKVCSSFRLDMVVFDAIITVLIWIPFQPG